jgi:hypothetical protein
MSTAITGKHRATLAEQLLQTRAMPSEWALFTHLRGSSFLPFQRRILCHEPILTKPPGASSIIQLTCPHLFAIEKSGRILFESPGGFVRFIELTDKESGSKSSYEHAGKIKIFVKLLSTENRDVVLSSLAQKSGGMT